MISKLLSVAEGTGFVNVGADLYRLLNKNRMSASEAANTIEQDQGHNSRAIEAEVAVYVNKVKALARAAGVETPEISDDDHNCVNRLIEVEHFLDRLYAENLAELEADHSLGFVPLDGNWKGKISSYVEVMRGIVRQATMRESNRERIFKALDALQREVDRNRTRPQAWAEVWLTVTEAMGQGAKNLEPLVRVLERGAGAVSRLHTGLTAGHIPPRLPPPERLGMDDIAPPE